MEGGDTLYDIPNYQIRRLSMTLLSLGSASEQQWRLLRKAGLSKERLTDEANRWLEILRDKG